MFSAVSKEKAGVGKRCARTVFGAGGSLLFSAVRMLSFVSVCGLLLALTVFYFNIEVDYTNFAITSSISESRDSVICCLRMCLFLAFTKEGFAGALEMVVPLVAVIAALSLCVELLNSFIEYVFQLVKKKQLISNNKKIGRTSYDLWQKTS